MLETREVHVLSQVWWKAAGAHGLWPAAVQPYVVYDFSCFDACLVSLFVHTVRKNSLHAVSFQAWWKARVTMKHRQIKLKSFFQSHLTHKEALILNSSALNQAPTEAAGPWTWDQCVAWCACLPPSLHCHQAAYNSSPEAGVRERPGCSR